MKTLNNFSPQAHWFLRIAIASVFIYHGLKKFINLEPMAKMMNIPVAMLFMIALAESVGGLLVLAGGFLKDWTTRVGALFLAPVMLGAQGVLNPSRSDSEPYDEFHRDVKFIIKGDRIL